MNLTNIAKTVANYGAPLLGALLGGPPAIALEATKLITQAFGGSTESLNSIVADPESALKIKEIESNEKIRLQTLAAEMAIQSLDTQITSENIAEKDRENARAREIEISKIGKYDDTAKILALGYTAGFLILMLIFGFTRVYYPQVNFDSEIMGLISIEMLIAGYYFGTSASSARKDIVLGDTSRVLINKVTQ